MNTMLYLIGQVDRYISYGEFFESFEIMNEQQVREFFEKEVDDGHIPQANLEAHDVDANTNVYDLDISKIFGVLCDNDEYDDRFNYYVSQQEVHINEEDMYD